MPSFGVSKDSYSVFTYNKNKSLTKMSVLQIMQLLRIVSKGTSKQINELYIVITFETTRAKHLCGRKQHAIHVTSRGCVSLTFLLRFPNVEEVSEWPMYVLSLGMYIAFFMEDLFLSFFSFLNMDSSLYIQIAAHSSLFPSHSLSFHTPSVSTLRG